MARVTQISVSLDETVRFAHEETTALKDVRLSITLRADCEPGPLMDQIARLQTVARKVLANERSHLLRERTTDDDRPEE